MNKIINILIVVFLVSLAYSQSCTANAGGDSNIILDHNGSPGGDVTFDGSETIGDNLGQFQWQIYHLPVDTLSYTAMGVNPTIDIDCYSSINPDDTWTDCLADYRIELTVPCDDGQSDIDIVNLSVTEQNDPPLACLSTLSDTWDVNGNGILDDGDNQGLIVPNNTGIPGEETSIQLFQYALINLDPIECPQPDSDFSNTFLWFDDGDNQITPVESLGDGIHVFTFRRVDAYETYSELTLTLEIDEENQTPNISIAAINEADIGLDQIVIDGDQIDLFGDIIDPDGYNDVDDIDGDGNEDDILYNWNFSVIPEQVLTINNPNTLNPTITAPSISNNSETTEITITLEAEDPFQILDGESSISNPILITVANDNSSPEITNSTSGYTILEDDSSELNYTNIDDYIDVTDSDESSFLLVINQEDIDSDPATYSNYSLIGTTTIVPDNNYYGQITVPIRLDDGYTVNGDCYNCLSDIADFTIEVEGINDAPLLSAPIMLSTD